MGCLNSRGQFQHWFSNIHFSGPCNRSCYFCIGQHMMALDSYNNLAQWPLDGIDQFVASVLEKNCREVYLTGTNTDPSLYKHIPELRQYLKDRIPGLLFGMRTNGVNLDSKLAALFDRISVSFHSTNPAIYKAMLGGEMPSIGNIVEACKDADLLFYIVLGPENKHRITEEVAAMAKAGVKKINIREPYGQPHVGNPLDYLAPSGERFGGPVYFIHGVEVMYWDVHYTEVESINLYANGHVSTTYPVTRGHDFDKGSVNGQEAFFKSGRVREQWL